MPYPKLKLEPVKAALLEFSGNTAAVARKFGVRRQAVQQFIQRHDLRDLAIEAKETVLDNVESALYRSALNGEAWAVCFLLKTQAKHRGYVERAEVANAPGESLRIQVEYVDEQPITDDQDSAS